MGTINSILTRIARIIPKPLLPFCLRVYHFLGSRYNVIKLSYQQNNLNSKERAIKRAIRNNCSLPKNFKIGMAVLAHERPEYLEACFD